MVPIFVWNALGVGHSHSRQRRPIPPASAGFVGSEVELEITNVAHGGVFVARLEGRVVFVSDALPGERVRARISDDSHKSFWRADTVSVLDASPHRREHIWPEAGLHRSPENRPGGADFGHIELPFQRELKAHVLVDAFARMAKQAITIEVTPAPGDDASHGLAYRTREFLHVDASGRVGPYAARSHRVVEVDSLPLATSTIAAAAPLHRTLSGVNGVTLVDSDSGLVVMETRSGEAMKAPVITQRVGKRDFRLRASGFWQVHHTAAEVLSRVVVDAIDDQMFDPRAANLDLYGGVGLFSAAVGDAFGPTTRITTVELDEGATEFAAENLAEWIGARALTSRVDRFIADLVSSASATQRSRVAAATVILDPPRSGAGKLVIDGLASLSPAQIIYVACDPVALARDAQLLAARGYHVAHIEAHDLFPHTHHVETVARFVSS